MRLASCSRVMRGIIGISAAASITVENAGGCEHSRAESAAVESVAGITATIKQIWRICRRAVGVAIAKLLVWISLGWRKCARVIRDAYRAQQSERILGFLNRHPRPLAV